METVNTGGVPCDQLPWEEGVAFALAFRTDATEWSLSGFHFSFKPWVVFWRTQATTIQDAADSC